MMCPPQQISPGARARRALLVDAIFAVILALVGLQLAAGLGVVAFFGLPLLLLGLLWIAVERLKRRKAPLSHRSVAGSRHELGR